MNVRPPLPTPTFWNYGMIIMLNKKTIDKASCMILRGVRRKPLGASAELSDPWRPELKPNDPDSESETGSL